MVARELATEGYQVRDYAEGKQGWIGAGLPTESGGRGQQA